jgi:hypothetical protein
MKPIAANGAAPSMHTQLTVSVPKYGFSPKYIPTAVKTANNENASCLSDNPKNIDSV